MRDCITRLNQLVRTIGHLRPSQLAWRVKYRLGRPREEREAERLSGYLAARVADAVVVVNALPETPSPKPLRSGATRLAELDRQELTLLNETRTFRGGADWCMEGGREKHRLWTYNLHYHVWLLDLHNGISGGDSEIATGCAERLAQTLHDWLRVCRPGQSGFTHFSWNSFTIATRMGTWAHLAGGLPDWFWSERPELWKAFNQSFAMQAAYLHEHLEWDVRGNHLLRDAAGLAWAARAIEHRETARWLTTATELAMDQAAEQVLSDGGHFERSPMYHLQVMCDVLALAQLVKDEDAARALRKCWWQMAEFAAWVRHPDGQIPLLNDSTLNGACSPEEVLRTGREGIGVAVDRTPRQGGRFFDQFGLAVWHGRRWSVFFDVGPIGPDYQPGHAHADTLTFECSFRGSRLIVDPGVFAYDRDATRAYDRATWAHNTVCIDGENSSEVWHIFRVGRRARTLDVSIECDNAGMTAAASHDGYRFLRGRPRHRRSIEATDERGLSIVDDVQGSGRHHLQGGLLLHPDWSAQRIDGHAWLLTRETDEVVIMVDGPAALQIDQESAVYHPEFGLEQETVRLVWRCHATLPVRVSTSIAEAHQAPVRAEEAAAHIGAEVGGIALERPVP